MVKLVVPTFVNALNIGGSPGTKRIYNLLQNFQKFSKLGPGMASH